ncbi:hypothetical protein Scel_79450 [Streptomyces cellostaticus]|nr:hypothetical protein Scel_79450 [Streptomyces cellostaticus]
MHPEPRACPADRAGGNAQRLTVPAPVGRPEVPPAGRRRKWRSRPGLCGHDPAHWLIKGECHPQPDAVAAKRLRPRVGLPALQHSAGEPVRVQPPHERLVQQAESASAGFFAGKPPAAQYAVRVRVRSAARARADYAASPATRPASPRSA